MSNFSENGSQSQESLTHALSLSRLGWAVVPLKAQSKVPLVRWKDLQTRKLTEHEIIRIFEQNPDANVGVVTGTVSQLLVLDADSPETVKKLGVPETVISETARGRHYYFALPDTKIRSAANIADGLDIRAEGGYVVAPPSLHPSGQRYTWIIPPRGLDIFGAEPAPPPRWLLDMLAQHRAKSGAPTPDRIVHGVPEGARNVSSTVVIGKLLGCLPVDDWERIAWPLVRSWNLQNKPPLSEKQLRYTFESIARKELHKRIQISKKHNDLLEKFVNFVTSNFSQAQIAQNLNVSQSTVSRLLKSLKSPSTSNPTSKRISFESKISNGCEFSTRKLCTKEGGMHNERRRVRSTIDTVSP